MSMSAQSARVKPRPYDASGRQARAKASHDAALEAASALFLSSGYNATTVEAIAQRSGVTAATIYKSHGGKAGLIRELCRRALEGTGPTPAHERSNALRDRGDATALIEGWGRLLAEVSPVMSPLLLVLRTAADGDGEAAALYAELNQSRLDRMAENARFLARAAPLADGVTRTEVRDVLWLTSSPELFDLLVTQRGWSLKRFAAFVTRTLMRGLLA